MNFKIEFIDDLNVRRHPDAPGHMLNVSSDTYVQLRPLSLAELRAEWEGFRAAFRTMCTSFLTKKTSDVRNHYGKLELSERLIRRNEHLEFGLLYEPASKRFTHFRQNAVIRALVSIGAVPNTTPHGKPRKRVRNLIEIVEGLDPDTRCRLISEILSPNCFFDDVLNINQTGIVDDRAIGDYLNSAITAPEGLEMVARKTEIFFKEQKTGHKSKATRGSGRVFGWAWFAQYLSTRGIWLQPPTHISDIVNLYPRKIGPIAAWIAVPPRHRELGDLVWSRMAASRHTSAAAILNAYLTIAQSSTAFQGDCLVTWPLVYFKEWAQDGGVASDLRSSSTNHLYRLLCNYHGAVAAEHETAAHFLGRRRTAKSGANAFNWCDNPNKRNTMVVERCLGRPVKTVPSHVRDWAEHFRELLHLFGTRSVDNQIEELNTWLIYMLLLGEAKAPKSFRDVVRSQHVNDHRLDSNTYVNFLKKNFSDTARGIAYRSPATMAKAFKLASVRDKFDDRATQPFDAALDRIGKSPVRHAKSVRPALDLEVLEIISRENRRDDFQFARNLGGKNQPHFRMCRNSLTGEYERVFFPLSPVLIDVILHSGIRKHQARWLDSGEGDERKVDLATKSYVTNTATTAQANRKQGFIQLVEYIADGHRHCGPGMFINTNKTGPAYEVAWIDPETAKNVELIARLQAIYNPMNGAILARNPDRSSTYGYSADLPTAFPLFRDPKYDMHFPISDNAIARYWRELLAHCEPIIEQELGYRYPLFRNGQPIFDIHSLRVTLITVLHEQGVTLEVLQNMAGHLSIGTTSYYAVIRHGRVQREMNRAKLRREAETQSDETVIRQVLDNAIEAPDADDPVGIALLRKHSAAPTAPIDFFNHGICPGGDCNTGGRRISAGRHRPVFRQRACSRCRFRVTGPRYLTGLSIKADCLMLEMKFLQEKEVQLNAEADQAEDKGKSAAHLRTHARKVRESRDDVFQEWISERKTRDACKAIVKTNPGALISTSSEFDVEYASGQFRIMHQFELLHCLVVLARLHPEIQIDLPTGAEEKRNNALYRLVQKNNAYDLLRLFRRDDKNEILDALGDHLIARSGDPDQLEQILEGNLLLKDVPALHDLSEETVLQAQTVEAG